MDRIIYLQPGEMVFETLVDLMKLQKGIELFCDRPGGMLHFAVSLYDVTWEMRFTITDIDNTRCAVVVDVVPGTANDEIEGYAEIMARREYALLDALLLIGTPHEVSGL